MKKLNIKLALTVTIAFVYLFAFSNAGDPSSNMLLKSICEQNFAKQQFQEYNYYFSLGEKKMIVDVFDSNSTNTASAIVIIYSLDGMDELGPFDVYEGTPLNVDIDNREWGVQIVDQTLGSEVTWRIE